ncbi:MAG TPA: hypothetical protein VND64_37125 [Pirellulales bacterium]|nr:hypothetical protein [Pirellulales bacterium]
MPTTREIDNPPGDPYRSTEGVESNATTKGRHPRSWIVRHVVGWSSLAIGVTGLVLPILPGWPFIAWGVVTLAPDIPVFARLLDLVERKVPRLRPLIERVRGDAPRGQE